MSCGCGGSPPVDGWRLIPEQKWAQEAPLATTAPAPAPQPGRAPSSSSASWSWWVWGLLAVMVLSYLGRPK
ncbi:MAG: hypothetical protein ACJ8GN_02110 [Longimicrobiaceae bacterium]